MRIVGFDQESDDAFGVHTIDIWYSHRRQVWVVERLDAAGDQVGPAHHCACEEDAGACLAAWLRAHAGTHLCAPQDLSAAERRVLASQPAQSRRAA